MKINKKCPSCGMDKNFAFCSNGWHKINDEVIEPTQQELLFQLSEKIESAFDINYISDGERIRVYAYEIESQLHSMLVDMGCEIVRSNKAQVENFLNQLKP